MTADRIKTAKKEIKRLHSANEMLSNAIVECGEDTNWCRKSEVESWALFMRSNMHMIEDLTKEVTRLELVGNHDLTTKGNGAVSQLIEEYHKLDQQQLAIIGQMQRENAHIRTVEKVRDGKAKQYSHIQNKMQGIKARIAELDPTLSTNHRDWPRFKITSTYGNPPVTKTNTDQTLYIDVG